MAEKVIKVGNAAGKPVPMKLFATWEVERTSPNCIPRLCSLRLTRLVVHKALESDLNSIIIAVRMQSSKRTLRSNEIFLQQGKILDTVLDLSFSLQYPHFLKRDGNKLRIMLQRRKRYKNRTILGYKTLAVGLINMSEVLQQSKDNELSLYGKEHGMARDKVAQVTVLGLSSQPVDQVKRDRSVDMDNESDDDDDSYSSDQENSDSGENMVGGQVRSQLHAHQLPWNDLLGEGEEEHEPGRKGNKIHNVTRQRNFKQKFIALLRKFKVASDESDTEPFPFEDQDQTPIDEDFLYDDLSLINYSDSGPDMDPDEMSIESTPKPVLRPFFSQGIPTSSSMAEDMEHVGQSEPSPDNSQDTVKHTQDFYSKDASMEELTIPDGNADNTHIVGDHRRQGSNGSSHSATDANKNPVPAANGDRTIPMVGSQAGAIGAREVGYKRSSSAGREMRVGGGGKDGEHRRNKSAERSNSLGTGDKRKPKLPITEQLSELWLTDETTPEKILLVNISEKHGQFIAQCLQGTRISIVKTTGAADVEATIQFIVHKIQKFCNQNARVLSPIKIGVCGSDGFIGSVLKPYVETFSAKSSEWLNYVKFYIVPTGNNSVAKYLSSVDTRYSSLFQDSLWKEVWEKSDKEAAADKREIANRVEKYLSGATTSLGLPIGEVMLTCKQRGSDDESCQKFVPFISNVLIGPPSSALGAVAIAESEESAMGGSLLSSSPPSSAKDKVDGSTPPPSPAVSTTTVPQSSSSSTSVTPTSPPTPSGNSELLDLQVEYWPMSGSKKDKSSLKTAFRSLTVYRLPSTSEAPAATAALSMVVVTKEKNKKMMRIGKKTAVPELKSQTVDGIYRLVCTSRTQDYSLTVTIDGNELSRVKFFQLSAQWQTHVKLFPVALFGHVEAPC
ncbi:phosphofurin acidic cluster sorting protein 2-like isoform X2 [Lytechinus variegatus]|uniref:phosphofurin acidic cluster sorting protein 2-like isoform X2 n=1 Tax=Lytechinus variegatus TaxID=7654 RepID=UPI001BB0F043|nr:phosphofurin acidic cluster sorting protein 2-like isoform X2 [Lytechinus variegatus]